MSEANKNTLKDLGKGAIGLVLFCLIAFFVPDGSLIKKIFSYLFTAVLFGGIFWFTRLSNPLKRWLNKRKAKK